MYIEAIANIDVRVLPTKQEQEQRLKEIATHLAQEFPANGQQQMVDIVDEITIFIHQYGPVNEEQVRWLNTSDEVYDWGWNPGGVLKLPAEHPLVTSLPCYYTYQDETRTVRLDNDTQGFGTWLTMNNRDTLIHSQAELLTHLTQKDIPLTGWTQTVWFCKFCDQPGATVSNAFCLYCKDTDGYWKDKPYTQRHYTDTELGIGLLLGLAVIRLLIDIWRRRK